jgi:hypothetical protein
MLRVNLHKFLSGENPSSTQYKPLIALFYSGGWKKLKIFFCYTYHVYTYSHSLVVVTTFFFTILSGHCRMRLEDA